MQLIESTFNNFRCFKEYQINYGTQTTVFIGKNGTGKSSILSGIRRGLSFMFAKPKNFKKNLAISNNAKVKSFGKLEANFDPLLRSYGYPIKNDFIGSFNNESINWSLVKNTMNGGLMSTYYNDTLNSILSYYNNNLIAELPIIAVFADSFPHEKINLGTKVKKIISQDILPRDLGYYGWDERTNCIEVWLNRFFKVSNYEKDLNDEIRAIESQISLWQIKFKEAEENNDSKLNNIHGIILKLKERLNYLHSNERSNHFNSERLFIENKLIEFTKPISNEYNFINNEFELYRVSVNRPDKKIFTLELTFKDGRVIAFETLPMGYKRVFSLVIDLAYRSYILNENFESNGIVLIDEIELHLHPTLQQEILQRLQKTFPKIQFIVTTHSPLVISNFKANENNKIIKLEHDGNRYSNEPVENVFGLDYSTNLSEIMEVAPRPSTIDKYINAFLFLYGKKKNEEAAKMLDKLKEYVGGSIPKSLQEEINEQKKAYDL
jgi:AAA15 family ATPase/GTPase